MIDWDGVAVKHGYKDPVEMIEDLYWGRGLSLREVCDELVVSLTALIRFMKENGIGTKKRTEALRRLGSGPECPSCGSDKTSVVSSWGLSDRGYERERRCKNCGRYFRTVEVVGGVRTARAGSCVCANCGEGVDIPFDALLDTGTTFSCKKCGGSTVIVLMRRGDYIKWARERRSLRKRRSV